MKITSRIAVGFLLALTVIVLVVNVRSLYTTPVANTWVWWSGDETQSMVEERSLLETGLYTYRYAHDSTVAHGSGILKGSVWLVALLYAGPSFLTNSNFIFVGRTVTALLGLLLLGLVYWASRWFGARPSIAMAGVFLFASSTCYFIVSHSARPDVPVGIANLLLLTFTVAACQNPEQTRSHLFAGGALFGSSLLISLHVPIDCTLPVLFLLWRAKVLRSVAELLRFVAGGSAVFLVLAAIYFAATGAISLLGFFEPSSSLLPIASMFRPRTDLSNLIMRYFFAREWIPYYLTAGIVVAVLLALIAFSPSRRRAFDLTAPQRLWLEALPLFILSTIIFEARTPRYLIFVVPIFTVTLAFLAERIWQAVHTRKWRLGVIASACAALIIIGWQSIQNFTTMEAIGEQISAANAVVAQQIYGAILKDAGPSEVKLRTMLSTPAMLHVSGMERIDPYVLNLQDPVSSNGSIVEKLRTRGIRYVVTCNSSLIRDDCEDDEAIELDTAKDLKPIYETREIISDIGRNYDSSMCIGTDTIRVYSINPLTTVSER